MKQDTSVASAPEAVVAHYGPNRLRLRIPSRRGNAQFFQRVIALFSTGPFDLVKADPLTGSVLFSGNSIQLEPILEEAAGQGLFRIAETAPTDRPPLTARMALPIKKASTSLRALTSGQADLPGALAGGLILTGIFQLMRGGFRAPPWYTAFWYAFALVSTFAAQGRTGASLRSE